MTVSRGQQRPMRTLAAVFVCFGLFWGAWAVSALDIKHALAVSDGGFGLVLAAALLVAAGTNSIAGSLAERWGTGTALSRILATWAVLMAVGAVIGRPLAFGVVLCGVIALGGALDVVINVAGSAALADEPGRFVRLHGGFNAGAVAGALGVALFLQVGLSWRWMWLTIALVALVLAYQCRRVELPAGTVGERHGPFAGLRAVCRQGYVLLAIAFATAAMVEGGIDTWGVLFLREVLVSGLLVGTAAYVLGQVVAASARLTLGPAAGSLGTRRGVAVGAGLSAGGLTLMAVAPSAELAAVGLIAAAAGISVCWPLLVAHVGAENDRPALVIGGVASIGYLGLVIGPVLVGWVADTFGLRVGLLMLAAAAAFVAISPSRWNTRGR